MVKRLSPTRSNIELLFRCKCGLDTWLSSKEVLSIGKYLCSGCNKINRLKKYTHVSVSLHKSKHAARNTEEKKRLKPVATVTPTASKPVQTPQTSEAPSLQHYCCLALIKLGMSRKEAERVTRERFTTQQFTSVEDFLKKYQL